MGYEILEALKKEKAQPVSPIHASFKINAPAQQIANNLIGKKEIAESLKFQGFRVTESYDSAEPDLVVWKDATTPQEVISVKTILPPQTIDVSAECKKEIVFAQKHGFHHVHLICIDSFSRQKIYDSNVNFADRIEIKSEKPAQSTTSNRESVEISPAEKKHSLTLDLRLASSPVEITERVMAVSEAFGVGVDDKKEFTIFDNVELKYNDDDLIYVTGDSGSGKSTFLKLFGAEIDESSKESR